MVLTIYLDTILVPFSLLLIIGYHACLWYSFKTSPSTTQLRRDALMRKSWLLSIKEGDEKMSMLAVQSLRNTLMATILIATIAILINLALAAMSSNAYNGGRILRNDLLGAHSERTSLFKFGAASVLLLASFLCCSMAVGFLIDANFSVNACAELSTTSAAAHTHRVMERGFLLAVFGSRALCFSVPLLLWMFGPLPVAVSTFALIWGFYGLDFPAKFTGGCEKQSCCCLSFNH